MKFFTKEYWELVLFPKHAKKIFRLEFQIRLLENSVVELGRRLELKSNPKSAWLQLDTACIQDPPPPPPPENPGIRMIKEGAFGPGTERIVKPEVHSSGGWLTSK